MQTRTSNGFQTEVDFTLPRGFLDEHGVLHRKGVMRLATAADEILPLRDPRVQGNQAYLAVIVLARVITRLGDVPAVDTKLVEGLYASDFEFLQRLYERLNAIEDGEQAGAVDAVAGGARRADAASLREFRAVGEA